MSFDIDYDTSEAEEMFDRVINYFDERVTGVEAFRALGEFLVFKLKDAIQNEQHVVTGELLGSIRVIEAGDHFVVVGSDKLQARILEHGRIEIRSDKVLHWVDPDSGEDVFSHVSAAVKPTNIFLRTVKEALDEYTDDFVAGIR